jgi:hypothetical protein
MRRRNVSPEQLARIIRHRESNTSWLQIQRDTGVPRRLAKRAYEEWKRNQSMEELKAARKEVAAEEFRRHLNLLNRLADNIVLTICIPSSPNETRHAQEILGTLLQGDWLHELDFIPAVDSTERGKRRMGRQSRMLFESLQVHTHGKVRWQALDEWEEAWDTCISDLAKFREEAHKILLNILNQKPKLIEKIVEVSGKKDAMERMIDGVLHIVWQQLLEPDQDFPAMQPMPLGNGRTDLTFGKNHLTEGLIFTEADLAEEVAKACKWAAKNLYKGNTTLAVAKQINIMQERIKELEEMLDSLRLRSLILGTRCELCPV